MGGLQLVLSKTNRIGDTKGRSRIQGEWSNMIATKHVLHYGEALNYASDFSLVQHGVKL